MVRRNIESFKVDFGGFFGWAGTRVWRALV
jgi:hypothetical protein